jgi:uncharacterized protein YjiS (DUF1127 family)
MTMTSNLLAARWPAGKNTRSYTSERRAPLLWLQRLFWRNELKTLDLAQMRDCGLDPEAVRREAAKPFWRD